MKKFWTKEYWQQKKDEKKKDNKVEDPYKYCTDPGQFDFVNESIRLNKHIESSKNSFYGIDSYNLGKMQKYPGPLTEDDIKNSFNQLIGPGYYKEHNPRYNATVQLQIEAPEVEEDTGTGWGFE